MSSTTAIAWMGGGMVGIIAAGAVAAGVAADAGPSEWGSVAILGGVAIALLRMHAKQLSRAEQHQKNRDIQMERWVEAMQRIADRISESNHAHTMLGAKIDSVLSTSLSARADSDRRIEGRLSSIDDALRRPSKGC